MNIMGRTKRVFSRYTKAGNGQQACKAQRQSRKKQNSLVQNRTTRRKIGILNHEIQVVRV